MSLTLTRRHNVDRFGYLIPHRYGNLPMVGAVATYRPGEGRFGRGAVAVEEGTTNLLEQSRPVFGLRGRGMEFTVYGWEDGWYKLGIGGTWTGGTYPYIIAVTSSPFTGGTRYSTTLVGKTNVPHKFNTLFGSINYVNAPTLSGDRHSRQVLNDGSIKVQRLNFGYVDSTNQAGYISMRPISDGTTFDPTTDFIWVKEVQVEQKPFATSFVDGTRAAGRIMYPPELINVQEGTFSAWVYVGEGLLQSHAYIFAFRDGTSTLLLLQRATHGVLQAYVGRERFDSIEFSALPQGWHHFALTWTTSQAVIYVDGERRTVRSLSEPLPVPVNPLLAIGAHPTNNDRSLNSMIDELLILPYAASEEEIASWYEAQGPLPPHPQASLQWDWQTVRPAQMVTL